MNKRNIEVSIYFTDIFGVSKDTLNEYGAFNISLLSDLPLFIDPFLLFNSENEEYVALHSEIIKYLRFLKEKSVTKTVSTGLLKSLYRFKEVGQNWLGYSVTGNKGSALGIKFANALNKNFFSIFSDYGEERITKDTHLEKLCLIQEGVGKDNISDFTTNLIKGFLLRYTEIFAKNHINPKYCDYFYVEKVKFNYETETWESGKFFLPKYDRDFVILTPKDLLTKDDTWINRTDLIKDVYTLPNSISDLELRGHINNYLLKVLPQNPTKEEERKVANNLVTEFPVLVDYFIKSKENDSELASNLSNQKVKYSEDLYIEKFKALSLLLAKETEFYNTPFDTYEACMSRVNFLKDAVENKDGYRMFYDNSNIPIKKEEDLKIAYRLTWFGTSFSVDTEVNNGRGPADTVVAMGNFDATIVEFKLASNKKLKQNLENQAIVYEKARSTDKSDIVFFKS